MTIKHSIEDAFKGNLVDMQDGFRSELSQRAVNAIDEKKIQIAKTSFIKDE